MRENSEQNQPMNTPQPAVETAVPEALSAFRAYLKAQERADHVRQTSTRPSIEVADEEADAALCDAEMAITDTARQRDELLAALKAILPHVSESVLAEFPQVRKAIAAAGGGK